MRLTVDLNADLGETVDGVPTADDAALFTLITSANVACGGHAGDDASMRDTVALAAQHGVVVGAHPSYPDRAGFGREPMLISGPALREALVTQLFALHDAGADIRYVKPHGALYNVAVHDTAHAQAIVDATCDLADRIGAPVGVLSLGGELERLARAAGLPYRGEAFLDRGYRPDGTLVPRREPGAVLHDAATVAARAVRLALEGVVVADDDSLVAVSAASFCVHGDTPEAVEMAARVRSRLAHAGVDVRSPW